jgi:hypothetical protein
MEREERAVQYLKLAFGVCFAATMVLMLRELRAISAKLDGMGRERADQRDS